MLKVKAKVSIVEQSVSYKPGDVFETYEERVRALGDVVEIVELEKPPKDKMVSEPVKKKALKRKRKNKA